MLDDWSFVIIFLLSFIVLQLIRVLYRLDQIKDKLDHHNKVTVDMVRRLNDTIERHYSFGVDAGFSGWQPWSIDSFKEGENNDGRRGEAGTSQGQAAGEDSYDS